MTYYMVSDTHTRKTTMRKMLHILVILLYILLIKVSLGFGATLHIEANAPQSMTYVSLNGGVIPWSNFMGDTFVMPNYVPKPNGYHSNAEVSVTYSFPLNFYAQQADIYVRTAFPFASWSAAYALLDVSADGTTWTNVPTNEIVDISSLVHDSQNVYLRGRLWSEYGPIACQWMYTAPGQGPAFILNVNGTEHPAPEPSSIVLLIIGAACAMILGYKRFTRSF